MAHCPTDPMQGCFTTGDGSASVTTQKHISEPLLLTQCHKILLSVFNSKDNRSHRVSQSYLLYASDDPIHLMVKCMKFIYMTHSPLSLTWCPPTSIMRSPPPSTDWAARWPLTCEMASQGQRLACTVSSR